MNAINALLFAALGLVMEILPRAFPSWFPHTGADQSSARAIWLALMGSVQITLGLGFILQSHVLPVVHRVLSAEPASGSGSLALRNTRTAAGR